jgi:DNA-directed RNA polymerase beta subunit
MPGLADMIGKPTTPAPAAAPAPVSLTPVGDTNAMRNGIFDRVKGATEKRFPVENDRYRIELGNLAYKNNKPFSKSEQKDAILKQKSLSWKLHGDWRMVDKATNKVVDEKKGEVVAHVPYMTERGTFIRDGNEYTVSAQSRLRPGAYSRRKANGELETHFNILDGGRSFHVVMDPASAQFTMQVGGSKMNLYPVLRSMGVSNEQIQKTWGNEIYNRNQSEDDSAKRALKQFYRGQEEDPKLHEVMAQMKLDPEVMHQTLGERHDHVNGNAILQATQKLLNISRGASTEDDRDALHYQKLMFPDDLISERIEKDWDKRVTGKTLWNSSNRGKLAVYSGHLTPQIDAVFTKSGLASPIEEVNPMEVMDQLHRVMRTGEGGISESGVPDESRTVQPSHFGMIDPLKSPECFDAETEVFTIKGWIPWSQVTEQTELACQINGRMEFHVPFSVTRADYTGPMYGLKTGYADYLVTPNHRMWARCGHEGCTEYRFITADKVHMQNRRMQTGGHGAWGGKYTSDYFELPEVEIVGNATKVFPKIPMVAWASFMGWYLGEGCVSCDDKRGRYVTEISQIKPAFLQQIRRMIVDAFGTDTLRAYHGRGFTISGKQLALYLKQFGYCYDKYIPDYLLHGSVAVRRAVFDALLMGEGRDMSRPGNVHQEFRVTSKRLAEDFQFLAISLGYATAITFRADNRPGAHGTWDVALHKRTELGTPQTIAARKKAFYVAQYAGKVYCATVPGGLLYVRRGRGHAHWSGNSLKIGIDSRFTVNSFRGPDGLYTKLRNAKGQIVPVSVKDAVNSVVAFPGESARPGQKVRAMVNGKLEYVDRGQVQYEMAHPSHMFTVGTNLVPMTTGVAGQRVSMGSRFISQALAMKDPEAPLVQSLSDDGKTSFEELYGTKAAGAVRSHVAGRVTKVTPDGIQVQTPTGVEKFDLYNNFAYNRKSMIHNTPVVQVGQHVAPGALLAHSNFTDKNGTLGLGRNMRVAFMPWKGLNYEDAFVISRSAANKLTSEHLYPIKVDSDTHTQRGLKEYMAMFPTQFNQEQVKRLDETGVVKVGQIVKKGDPLVLAVRQRPQTDIHRGHKPGWGDASEVWDHESDGIITDVEHSKTGARIHVKTFKPMQEADKIANRYGGKGVVARIIADEQMPHDKDGNVMDVMVNPMGVVTRQNPAQLAEAILGKIALKTGKPYKMPAFLPPGTSLIDYTINEAKKHGVSDTEDLIDPSTGRVFKNIMTGHQHFMKLHFLAEKKKGVRDTGGYTSEDMPARGGPEGAKKLGVWDINALISHGATEVLKDAKTVRGQKNDEYWKAFQMGHTPPSPDVPLIYKKFLSHMIGAGINVKKSGSQLNIMALTDKDVDKLSRGEIKEPKGVNADTMQEIPGGLFDKGLTGGHNGCFHHSVQVWTDKGMLQIGDIVERRMRVNVMSYDFSTRTFVWKPVLNWFKNSVDGLRKFSFAPRARLSARLGSFRPSTLWATPTHGVFDAHGTKRNIIDVENLLAAQEELSYSQQQILFGGLLGDGTVSKHGYLAMGHGLPQREYLEWKAGVFSDLLDSAGVHEHTVESFGVQRTGVRCRTRAHAGFYEAYDRFYAGGPKKVSADVLQDIDELGLAVWYFDDGSVTEHKDKNTLYVTLHTQGFDYTSVCALQTWMQSRWGLVCSIGRDKNKYSGKPYGWFLRLCGPAAQRLLDVVAPYAVSCMRYKLGARPSTATCTRCDRPVQRRQSLCVDCLLSEAKKCGSKKIPKHVRRRLGGTADVRAMLAGVMDKPADCHDVVHWEARMRTAGSLCDPVAADTAVNLRVEEIQVELAPEVGSRWESCKTAYDIEVADTHNYVANGIVVSNSNWTHVNLHEPMPNPIMEEPIRRMLGLTQAKFEDVLSSKEYLHGRTGGEAIKESLRRINLPELKRKAEEQIQSGAKSKRSDAIKTLRYVNMMQKTGLKPEDFVLNKVPVLPPIFRPISATSKFTIKADANSLYVDMMKHNEALRDVKTALGHDQAGEERLNLYKSFKALTGLGDPVNPKLQSQGVTGLLKQVFGPASPKMGMFQYRVLGGTLDQSGLAVVTPNPSMDMDHVGLPEDHAWTLYKKFVVRKLVQRGMRPTDAIKAVSEKDQKALDALHEEMANRPVIVNRAPTLHKYNLLAFHPQLVKGHTLHVSPVVTGGFGMDFDGDTALMHVPVSDKAVEEAKKKMLPSKNLFAIKDFDVHYLPAQEYAYGLYLASAKKKEGETKAFDDVKAAIAAYKRGELSADDKVRIKDR